MRVDLFDFELPVELIAQHPLRPRDAARLLWIGREATRDCRVRDLPRLLRSGDLLVVNDTRVIPARLAGRRGAAKVEVTLHRALGGGRWRAFARPARRCRAGDSIVFADGVAAEVVARGEGGELTLGFAIGAEALARFLDVHGRMPLPPYIRRVDADPSDRDDYQTRFARRDGAVAAPTAGLHFTDALLAALEARGIGRVAITLHVGAGTFLPVKALDTEAHHMHGESYEVAPEAAAAVEAARAQGGRVVAVGTTVLRTLETVAAGDGRVRPQAGETRLFITPGFRFRAADLLLTNFHLPRSTLFMLVAAFAGLERAHAAYTHAMRARYRFYSYGDACLIERAA